MTSPQPVDTDQTILRLTGIAKRFGNSIALEDVSLAFRRGSVTALTGENGSGKSTIARIIGGLLTPDAGTVVVGGAVRRLHDPNAARRHGIALISQELTLAADLTVAENIFMGRLPSGGPAVISWRRMRAAAVEVLDACGVDVDPRARVGDLPIETQQQIEIARALSTDPDVLILDEATSSLSERAADRLLELVRAQRAAGTSIVMITHRMNEIFRVADTAAVLRDGRIVAELAVASTTEDEIVRQMVGRELGDYYGTANHTADVHDRVLHASALAVPDKGLHPVELSVGRGEIVGVAGLAGSGKETLGHALGGAVPATGDLSVGGAKVLIGRPDRVLDGGIGFVPEDRKSMGLLLNRSVAENFALAWRSKLFRNGVRRFSLEGRLVADAVARFDVRTASTQLAVSHLSGGNQQKIIIGRLFELELPVYVMCEPTRGIDVGARSAIYAMLREQAARGAAIVLISSELNELCGMCDRVLTMHRGRVVAEFVGRDVTEDNLNTAMVTGRRPQISA
ncbi:sugar ABC transporter ATP-binding protein [Gordonia sp. KTR9]|uniref:sugar ABC transporter ATP-binding protein n=1 Tax=Gordonia sp. KTR9 TaxID=337191 RepID=UPI000301D3D6|nr:sugar ABC transporter ATP-binding protein [Gordonia sp. KTR9]